MRTEEKVAWFVVLGFAIPAALLLWAGVIAIISDWSKP